MDLFFASDARLRADAVTPWGRKLCVRAVACVLPSGSSTRSTRVCMRSRAPGRMPVFCEVAGPL